MTIRQLAFAACGAISMIVTAASSQAQAATISGFAFGSKPSAQEQAIIEVGKKGISFLMSCDSGSSCFPLTAGQVTLTIGNAAPITCSVNYVQGNPCGYMLVPFDSTHSSADTFKVFYPSDFPLNTPVSVTVANVTGSGGASGCPSGNSCTLSFTAAAPASTPRIGTHTELVLDTSGSMSLPAVQGLALGNGCNVPVPNQTVTRICAVQLAARRFLAAYQTQATLFDKIGAFSFSSAPNGNAALGIGVDAQNLQQISQTIDALVPNGGTAIGQGLKFAKDGNGLSSAPAGDAKWAMLFTDGEQNIPPDVTVSGSTVAIGGTPYGGISVCPITTGPQTAVGFKLLQSIADASCNHQNDYIQAPTSAAFQAFLDTAFSQSLATMLQGDKFEISRNVTGSVGSQNTVDFPVNGNDLSFEVIVSALPVVERPRFELVAPDGTAVPVYPRSVRGTSIAKVELPLTVNGKTIAHQGYWRLVLDRGSFGDWPNYHVIVINDNPAISSTFSTLGGDVGTGDPLLVQARILEKGKPISDAVVTVDITGPSIGLGNILSTGRFRGELPNMKQDNPGSAGAQKLLMLASSPEAVKVFTPNDRGKINLTYCKGGPIDRNVPLCRNIITLNPRFAPGGGYVGNYPKSTLEGHYTFTFHAIGSTAKDGEFERTWRTTLFVRPKAYGPNTPILVQTLNRLPNGGVSATLRIEPHDRSGNFIGPGYDGALEIASSKETFPFAVDNLDGSYAFRVETPPGDSKLVLRVLGQDVKSIDLASARRGGKL
jgi:hypothetical protein